jgi:hypothetical protein
LCSTFKTFSQQLVFSHRRTSDLITSLDGLLSPLEKFLSLLRTPTFSTDTGTLCTVGKASTTLRTLNVPTGIVGWDALLSLRIVSMLWNKRYQEPITSPTKF